MTINGFSDKLVTRSDDRTAVISDGTLLLLLNSYSLVRRNLMDKLLQNDGMIVRF